MGYRSDIKLLIETNKNKLPATKILSWLDKESYETWKIISFDKDHNFKIVNDGDKQRIYFEADYIKWYSDFKEVNDFDNWILKIQDYIQDNNTDYLGIHFVRIGENYDDIQEIYSGELTEYIHVFRGMEFEKEK